MNIRNVISRGSSFPRKYLLLIDAFSLAITHFAFALVIVWAIYADSAAIPQWRLILLSTFGAFSFCMFFVFTYLMFSQEEMLYLRRLLEQPSDSYSKPVKVFRLVFPWTFWLTLPLVFITGLFHGTYPLEGNVRNIVLWIGLIWAIGVPLVSIIKLFIDEKTHGRSRIPKLTKLKPNFHWLSSHIIQIGRRATYKRALDRKRRGGKS